MTSEKDNSKKSAAPTTWGFYTTDEDDHRASDIAERVIFYCKGLVIPDRARFVAEVAHMLGAMRSRPSGPTPGVAPRCTVCGASRIDTRLKLTLSRSQVHALWHDASQHAITAEDERTITTWKAIAREAEKALQRATEKERDKRQMSLKLQRATEKERDKRQMSLKL